MEICNFDRLFSFDSYLLNFCSNFTKMMTIERSLDLRPSSSICLLMLCHSIAWVWQRTGDQFGGAARERQIEGLVDFPMKLPKLPQTCPEFCMRFYLTRRVERQSDITDGLFLSYLELYILNSAVIAIT